MKALNRLIAIALLVGSMLPLNANDVDLYQPKMGVTAGFTHLNGFGDSYSHDTHPNDFFLNNSGVPGSAGETEINNLDMFNIGAFWEMEFFHNWVFRAEAGALVGMGANRDEKKNINDTLRPDANGAFIYSDAKWGLYGSVSLTYEFESIPGFYIGGKATVHNVFVDHGWDRYNDDESAKKDSLVLPTFGPVIGFYFGEEKNTAVELGVHLGESTGASLMFRYAF